MKFTRTDAIVVAAFVAAMSAVALLRPAASAEVTCQPGSKPFTETVEEFARKYDEVPVASGSIAGGNRFLILANPEAPRTWTFLIVSDAGCAFMPDWAEGNRFKTH